MFSRSISTGRSAPSRRKLLFEGLEERKVFAHFIYAGTDAGPVSTVRTFGDLDDNDTYETLVQEFQPFGGSTSGVRVTTGDFDGDGNDELVLAAGANSQTLVKIYDINGDGSIGTLLDSFNAFGATSKVGIQVAAGDVDGDGRDELFAATDVGSGRNRSFSDTDNDGLISDNLLDVLIPFGTGYKGGLTLALTDMNNALGEELVVGQATGGSGIKVYDDANNNFKFSDESALESFNAFAASYKGGVNVAAGKFETFGNAIVAAGATNAKAVRIFNDSNNNGTVSDNPLFEAFNALPTNSAGGLRLATGDTDGSGSFVEVVIVPGKGPPSTLIIRDDTFDAGGKLGDNAPADQFQPYAADQTAGMFVAVATIRTDTASYAGNPQAINDSLTTISKINVPKGAGIIRDLQIALQIGHTFDGDLDITLTHVPSNTTVTLFTDIGGTDEGLLIRLSDDFATDIGTADNPNDGPITGNYNLEGAALLSIFDGLDASGEWRLSILDDNNSDAGHLYGWQLFFGY